MPKNDCPKGYTMMNGACQDELTFWAGEPLKPCPLGQKYNIMTNLCEDAGGAAVYDRGGYMNDNWINRKGDPNKYGCCGAHSCPNNSTCSGRPACVCTNSGTVERRGGRVRPRRMARGGVIRRKSKKNVKRRKR